MSDDVLVTEQTDQRHLKRIAIMQALFAYSFTDHDQSLANCPEEVKEKVEKIVAELENIDAVIQAHAPERPLHEINKVDLAILRTILFESEHKKTPLKVLINEAVELAKEFGSENSPKFVNGVLGKLLGGNT